MEKKIICSKEAPAPAGPYSQAVDAGEMVFFSGQIPLDPVTGEVLSGSAAEQAELALRNLEAVVKAAGLSMRHIVKTTIFLTDMGRFAEVNTVYGRFLGQNPPARSCVEVSALPKSVDVEIEAIAVK